MVKPKVGCYAVYEPTEEGWENWAESSSEIQNDLKAQALEVLPAPEAVCDEGSCRRVAAWFATQEVDLLHALIITWSFDHYTILMQQSTRVPVVIRTIPGIRTGSIVGGQQLGCVLTDLEIEHKLLYGAIGSGETAAETAVYAKACALKRSLHGARFVVVGPRTAGMTPTAIDEVELIRQFGIVLTNMGWEDLADLAAKVDPDEAEAVWRKVSGKAASVSSVLADGLSSSRNYLAMKGMVSDWGLSGVAMGAYPRCLGTMCLPLALLNEDGIAAGCEGDVNSTLVTYMLNQLTGQPVHFGEMLEIDEQENSIVSSHCGSGPPSLADNEGYVLCPVRLAHNGVCIRFQSKPGPITFVNLVGRKANYRMCAFEGQAVPTAMVFEGNPLRIRLHSPFRQVWNAVSTYGFGHHWMSGYGRVVPVLAEFCRMTGVKGVFPDEAALHLEYRYDR